MAGRHLLLCTHSHILHTLWNKFSQQSEVSFGTGHQLNTGHFPRVDRCSRLQGRWTTQEGISHWAWPWGAGAWGYGCIGRRWVWTGIQAEKGWGLPKARRGNGILIKKPSKIPQLWTPKNGRENEEKPWEEDKQLKERKKKRCKKEGRGWEEIRPLCCFIIIRTTVHVWSSR